MSTRWMLSSLVVFLAITAFLLWENQAISAEENINRPMPFLAGYVFTLLVMLLMTIETPVNHERRWWQVWKLYDPLTMVLFGFFFAIGVYLFGVYGNFSGRFRLNPDAFDWARFVLYLASAIGIIVMPWLIYRAWGRISSVRRRRTAFIAGCYCYGMVVVGYVFHEVSFAFGASMVALGTLTIVGVWWWERRHGREREVMP